MTDKITKIVTMQNRETVKKCKILKVEGNDLIVKDAIQEKIQNEINKKASGEGKEKKMNCDIHGVQKKDNTNAGIKDVNKSEPSDLSEKLEKGKVSSIQEMNEYELQSMTNILNNNEEINGGINGKILFHVNKLNEMVMLGIAQDIKKENDKILIKWSNEEMKVLEKVELLKNIGNNGKEKYVYTKLKGQA
jgi:hypothetical protein